MLQMPHILAAGGVRVTPHNSALPPVFDAEPAGQQAALQREVQEETGARRGQLVIKLRLRNLLFRLDAPPMTSVPVRGLAIVQRLTPRANADWDGDLIVSQSGEECSWR